MLVMLPEELSDPLKNAFGMVMGDCRPMIDFALEDVYEKGLLPRGSLQVTFKDTKLSDAHGPQETIDAYCQDKVDVIVGFAHVFALAPVARMSHFWFNGVGVPVITTIGMQHTLDDKKDYPLLTRMLGTYTMLAHAVVKALASMNLKRPVFAFHQSDAVGRTECEFQLLAVRQEFLNKYPDINYESSYYKLTDKQPNLDHTKAISMKGNSECFQYFQ